MAARKLQQQIQWQKILYTGHVQHMQSAC